MLNGEREGRNKEGGGAGGKEREGRGGEGEGKREGRRGGVREGGTGSNWCLFCLLRSWFQRSSLW